MAAGTLSVTNNSKAVVGVGTTFTAFKAGDFLTLVVGQVPYTVAIASIESATALTLVLPFDGPTATGLAWDGVKRDTMSLATMGVTVQAQKALRLMIADENNWRAIFGDAEEITVTLPNGQVMQGMSWGYLSSLLKEVDPVEMRNLQQQAAASEAAAQGFRNEAEGFKNDTNTIKTQTNQIKADTQAIHDATNTIKTQTNQIKTDTGAIRDQANTAKTAAQDARDAAQDARDAALGYRDEAEQFKNEIAPSQFPKLGSQNRFTQPQEFFAPYPGLNLTSTAVGEDYLGRTILIENDTGNRLNFFYKKQGDNTGRYTISLPKPENTQGMTIGLDGGLAPNGNSYNNGLGGGTDFSVGQQGWRSVGGAWDNAPTSGNSYGAVFTHASQGLNVGGYRANGTNGRWFMQRFYDTSSNIYTRVQTNAAAWSNWVKVTTSAISDERLKDIKGNLNVEGALDNINRMEFKLFSFKNEKSESKQPVTRRGVISQQIRLIDKEYTTEVGGFYHLDQTPMLLDGLAAIKALRARDEANKAEIAELKAAVEDLKAAVAALSKA